MSDNKKKLIFFLFYKFVLMKHSKNQSKVVPKGVRKRWPSLKEVNSQMVNVRAVVGKVLTSKELSEVTAKSKSGNFLVP